MEEKSKESVYLRMPERESVPVQHSVYAASLDLIALALESKSSTEYLWLFYEPDTLNLQYLETERNLVKIISFASECLSVKETF